VARFRDELIRASFEAHRDLEWAQTLEPTLRESGIDDTSMKAYREAWNAHAESRDWLWWQNDAKRFSNEQLDNERMECLGKLNALGLLHRERNRATEGQVTFQHVLDATSSTEERSPEQAQARTRGQER
jgi:hypothetical protein